MRSARSSRSGSSPDGRRELPRRKRRNRMPLRIACDLDGTVADMDAALQREARRLFGPEIELHAFPGERLESAEDVEGQVSGTEARAAIDMRTLTSRQLAQLWRHVSQIDNFWMSLGEIEPGIIARLSTLARRLRWELIFLTQRPPSAGETTQVQSQRWLAAHGFEFPSVMVMRGSRGRVASALALDVVIDDRPENCLDVLSDSQAQPFLIWRLGADNVPPSVAELPLKRFSSIADAVAVLQEMTAERERGPTLFGRLKRALGGTP